MYFTQTVGRVRKRYQRNSGQRSSKKANNHNGTLAPASYQFLKTCFSPRRDGSSFLDNSDKVTADFYKSLQYITTLYNINIEDTSALPFPLNIGQAFDKLANKLNKTKSNVKPLITVSDRQSVCIATAKPFYPSYILYYIPVRPLVWLIADKERTQEAALLISVFSYLYQVVGIAYFKHAGSYLENCYGIIKDWLDTATYDGEDTGDQPAEMDELDKEGEKIFKEISNASHLQQFGKRLQAFQPVDTLGQEMNQLAKKTWHLYRKYPARSLAESIPADLEERDTDEDEETVMDLHHYVSFIYDYSGLLYESLMDYINSHLRELQYVDYPTAYQLFDRPQKRSFHNLSFENKVFNLMEEVCQLLNLLYAKYHEPI